ncbi:MAG TPA: carboxypeptidase-like regulatory domain-containing protein [Gemmatimonadaceae bacterium]
MKRISGLRHALHSTMVAAMATIAGARAGAQRSTMAPPPAGPRTLVGVVSDTLGNPVDSVEVFITSLKRRTMSTADGAFRFDDLKAGTYDVTTRRLGFLPQLRRVNVGGQGGTTTFSLIPYMRGLPPVVSAAARGGLSGVIGDTAYNIVAGAQISVMASDRRAVSDSTGAFFLDLKPGRHLVRVKAPGFASRLVSVTIPNDSGRRMVVWLSPSTRGESAREEWAMDGLNERLMRRNPVWSTIYSREDIIRMGMTDAAQIATIAARKRVDESCPAIIDGGPRTAPIWAFAASDIETIETYASRPASYGPTSIMSRGHAPPPAESSDCPITVYLWLRK